MTDPRKIEERLPRGKWHKPRPVVGPIHCCPCRGVAERAIALLKRTEPYLAQIMREYEHKPWCDCVWCDTRRFLDDEEQR